MARLGKTVPSVKEQHQNAEALIRASLEALVRHLAEESRRDVATLRADFDKALSSFESRLSASDRDAAVQDTLKRVVHISTDRSDRERVKADATVEQALAANALLRATLTDARQQIDSARAQVASAEADLKAAEAQHRNSLTEKNKLAAESDNTHAQLVDLQVQLKRLQQTREELTAECADLRRKLAEATSAREFAQAGHAELASVNQKLSDALSKTLHQAREERRSSGDPADVSPRSSSPKQKSSSAVPQTSVPAAPRKVLQFSEQARDSKRIAMRQGTHISVEGIPGELVDLSVGGAQVVLRQSVKPNQLVRLHLPTSWGEMVVKARVVWVIYEHREVSLSVYRTGLKLTEFDTQSLERFMRDFCVTPLAQSGA
jgi:chromosome segregation ATPase